MSYCQWVHAEKREIREIDVEKHNRNAGNSTDCVDITISENAADGLIADAINYGVSMDCSDDYSDGEISTAIDADDSTDCADITISDEATYGLIATAIDSSSNPYI